MAQHKILTSAVALAFLTLTACASPGRHQSAQQPDSIPIGASGDAGTEEFHGAPIGPDTLRGALPSEN